MRREILFVDDEPEILSGFQRTFHKDFAIKTATNADQAMEVIKHSPNIAVCVVDMNMPVTNGIQLLRRIETLRPEIVRIMLTGATERDTPVRAVNEGHIFHFLQKPCDKQELSIVIRRALAEYEKVIKRQDLENELRLLAYHDELTGLLSRRRFFELAQIEIERTSRFNRPAVMAMLDVDHFKNVNDTYGHSNGDEVLREIAKRIQAGVRALDLVGRYGGEEIAIFLVETDQEQGLEVLERIRQDIKATPIITKDSEISVSASIGYCPLHANALLADLIEEADKALYIAKEKGRNRVEKTP